MARRRAGDPPENFVRAYEGHGGIEEARRVWAWNLRESEKLSKPKREPASVESLSHKVPRSATLQLELVKCGKPKCRKWHGPYWYAYWSVNNRTRTAYIGSSERLKHLYEVRDRLSSADARNMVAGDHHVAVVKHRRTKRRKGSKA